MSTADHNWHASLVMPLLSQRDDWLRKALESAAGQSCPCEILVITSPDTPPGNLEIVADFSSVDSNVRQYCTEPHGHFPHAINLGFRMANSARIGLLFCDDWLQPNAVESALEYDSDIVCSGYRLFKADGKTQILERRRTLEEFHEKETLERQAAYLGHFFMFRREKLEQVGGVDETIGLTGPDDFDMVWSLLELDVSVSVIPEPLYCMRDHDEIRLTLRDRESQIRDITKILVKHGVPEAEIPGIVETHARWFGRPMQEVLNSP